ncbi:hypothetical protein SAY87_025418 [Trapa incisa]|nr:hypothetical protein SAY87_025418 [Trapa incisa]
MAAPSFGGRRKPPQLVGMSVEVLRRTKLVPNHRLVSTGGSSAEKGGVTPPRRQRASQLSSPISTWGRMSYQNRHDTDPVENFQGSGNVSSSESAWIR